MANDNQPVEIYSRRRATAAQIVGILTASGIAAALIVQGVTSMFPTTPATSSLFIGTGLLIGCLTNWVWLPRLLRTAGLLGAIAFTARAGILWLYVVVPPVPVPEFEIYLSLQADKISERLPIYNVSWRSTYRPYHLLVKTKERSAIIERLHAEVYFPGLVVSYQQLKSSNYSGYSGLQLSQAQDTVSPSTFFDRDNTVAGVLKPRSNDLRIDAEEVRAGSELLVELVLDYKEPTIHGLMTFRPFWRVWMGAPMESGLACINYQYQAANGSIKVVDRYLITCNDKMACTLAKLPNGDEPSPLPLAWDFDWPLEDVDIGEGFLLGSRGPSCE